jgi:ABC-type polar amino acid transport system ATPase subunit
MNKQDELNILQETIDKLGEYSYLGPWLAQVKDEVAALIAADMQPHLTIADAIYASKEITFKAEQDAERLKQAIENERVRLERHKQEYLEKLHSAGRQLQKVAEDF